MKPVKTGLTVLGTALALALVVAQIASLSLGDTIQAREYVARDRVALPRPGQMYELVGTRIVRSPLCELQIADAWRTAPGERQIFVNQLGEILPAVVGIVAGVIPTGADGGREFRDFQRSLYEVVWEYDELSMPSSARPPASARCVQEMRAAAQRGSCILAIDTVLKRSDGEVRANADGSIAIGGVFAVSFKPRCALVCTEGATCEPRAVPDAITEARWVTRLKLGLGVVQQRS
ncbi:hypothetical protein GE300_18250 [Rhodobacteraceae bacterium 2CG4]|uniref:Uncharacterized protein n=1 Tax=Halovulum marinum TaxID=2662447 RepID=A0A6L5Z650_9RHOB|nr:hypothetical protein [Halovulum marinum]MSU91524.1 hypothetical protein [Halovulum marinum]